MIEIEVCTLCGSPDRDKQSDHLREVYKITNEKLDKGQYHPHLFYDEMIKLQRGGNPVCSNMRKCRERQKQRNEKAKTNNR